MSAIPLFNLFMNISDIAFVFNSLANEKQPPPSLPEGRGMNEKDNVLTPLLHNSLTPKEKRLLSLTP